MYSFFYPKGKNPINKQQLSDSFFKFNGGKIIGKNIENYFTDDILVIKYRNELFRELLISHELRNALKETRKILKEFNENFLYIKKIAPTTESALRSILTSKDYIELIDKIHLILKPFSELGITSLNEIITSLSDERSRDDFLMFEKEIVKYEKKINNIKSVTVGINLDSQLRPKEAGLISVNTEVFKSGSIIDRFFRLEFKKDEYCCIAPLSSMTEGEYFDRLRVDDAVNKALDSVIKCSAKRTLNDVVKIIQGRMVEYSLLADELDLIASVIRYIEECNEKGLPLSIAEFEDNDTQIKGYYDPLLLKKKTTPIKNDMIIPKNKRIIIFTGPNSGGKTASLRALGLIYIFAVLGVPIPCEKAILSYIPKNIHVAFSPENATDSKGRLEQECEELGNILKCCDQNSMVFLDEPFVTTSPKEGEELLTEFTERFIAKDNATVFITTHFLDFARNSKNREEIMCFELGTEEKRYKIISDSVAESSNARTISEKYW